MEFCSQNLGIGVHRWQGGEGIIIQLGWGWSVSVNWAGRGDLREEGKENLSAPSPKPALPGICCQNQHYSHFPHLTWILSMQAPKLHISSIPQLRLSQDFEEKFFFLCNCVQLHHYLESAPQHFPEHAGIFYGLRDLWLGFSLCLGCGR